MTTGAPGYGGRSSAEPETFPAWLRARAAAGKDKVAFEVNGVGRSYAENDDSSDRLAGGLIAAGLRPGEHVATMMRNSVESIEVMFALQKGGMVEVPVHSASRDAVLHYILDHTDARALVIDEGYLPHLAAVADRLPTLKYVIVRREGGDQARTDLPSGMLTYELAELFDTDTPPPDLRPDRTRAAMILHTSGTTGPPKGAVHSHASLLHLIGNVVWMMDYTRDDRLYTAFPLFHTNARFTSLCAAMEAGASLIMGERFSVSGFWEVVREKEITAFNYMGATLMMLYKQPSRADDAENDVRVAMGAPCPVEIWEPFERRFGLKLIEGYGMTEIGGSIAENRAGHRKLGSMGCETPAYELQVVDDSDEAVPAGVAGQIVLRPRRPWSIFSEYYRRPEATAEAWRNLWFHTGDRGRMDEEGFLFFVDRMTDSIRRRGENISTWEIESAVNMHPAVLEAAAYGVPSELSESDVMIAVVRRPGATLSPEELLDFCQDRMARFAVPRYVRFVEALPKNHAERVLKGELREEGVTAETWDREVVDPGGP